MNGKAHHAALICTVSAIHALTCPFHDTTTLQSMFFTVDTHALHASHMAWFAQAPQCIVGCSAMLQAVIEDVHDTINAVNFEFGFPITRTNEGHMSWRKARSQWLVCAPFLYKLRGYGIGSCYRKT